MHTQTYAQTFAANTQRQVCTSIGGRCYSWSPAICTASPDPNTGKQKRYKQQRESSGRCRSPLTECPFWKSVSTTLGVKVWHNVTSLFLFISTVHWDVQYSGWLLLDGAVSVQKGWVDMVKYVGSPKGKTILYKDRVCFKHTQKFVRQWKCTSVERDLKGSWCCSANLMLLQPRTAFDVWGRPQNSLHGGGKTQTAGCFRSR